MRLLVGLLLTLNVIYFLWSAATPADSQLSLEDVEHLQGAVPKLLMVKEVPQAMLKRTQAATVFEEPQADPQPEERVAKPQMPVAEAVLCYEYGPTESKQASDALIKAVRRYPGSKAEVKTDKKVKSRQYWVHIPSYRKEATAIRVSRQLREKKVDNFRVTSGEDKNAISLGLFSQKSTAERIQQRVLKMGYRKVLIKERKKYAERYWVRVEQRLPEQAVELWPGLAKQFPKFKRTDCK